MACRLGTEHPCGFCKLHRMPLSVKQIKSRECLQHECWHLLRNYNHGWFIQRDNNRARQKGISYEEYVGLRAGERENETREYLEIMEIITRAKENRRHEENLPDENELPA